MRLPAIWPADLDHWRGSRLMLLGLERFTFRRNGVTLLIHRTEDHFWRVEKIKGGKVIDTRMLKRLPAAVTRNLDKLRTGVS